MKMSIIKNFKIWLIIAVCVMVVGGVLLGVFGFNQTVDYKPAYEVQVKVDESVGDSTTVMKNAADKYLAEKGLKTNYVAIIDDGVTVCYKFETAITIDKAEMRSKIDEALKDAGGLIAGLESTVSTFETVGYKDTKVGGIALALGVSVVAIFVYLLFMTKWQGALASLASAAVSSLLFIALIAITRLPAHPFVLPLALAAGVIAAAFSSGMLSRFTEQVKNVGNDKLSLAEIAEEGEKKSLFRIALAILAATVFAVALVVIGLIAKNCYLSILGAEVFITGIVSAFSSLAFTGKIWSSLYKR